MLPDLNMKGGEAQCRVSELSPCSRWAKDERDLVEGIQRLERQIALMEGRKRDLMEQQVRQGIAEGEGNSSESSFYSSHAGGDGNRSLSWDDNETNAPDNKKGLLSLLLWNFICVV